MKTILALILGLVAISPTANAGYVIYEHPVIINKKLVSAGKIELIKTVSIVRPPINEWKINSRWKIKIKTQSGVEIKDAFSNEALAENTYKSLAEGKSIDISNCAEGFMLTNEKAKSLKLSTDYDWYQLSYQSCSTLEKTPIVSTKNLMKFSSLYLSVAYKNNPTIVKQEISSGILACFTGDTQIATTAGVKRIDEITVGDTVISYNSKTEKEVTSQVMQVFTHEPQQVWNVTFSDGTQVKATPNHPFYVKNSKSFVELEKINPKTDVLLKLSKDLVSDSPVTIAKIEKNVSVEKVYNFEVEGTHTYFANGILVHNLK